jgi:hypothetical protein
MRVREGFGRYWWAGLIFSIIFGAITTVLNFFSTNITSYALNLLPGLTGGLLLLMAGILIFIFLPWIVGDCAVGLPGIYRKEVLGIHISCKQPGKQ